MKTIPEILTQPNIPKPLHGMNPRTILGKDWWDKQREIVYAKYDYHCLACGVHKSKARQYKWLEAHEHFNIDYVKGKLTLIDIIPLCHYCHNFIHSGRLSMIEGKDKSKQKCIEILEHGFSILWLNGLKCFEFTLQYAKEIGVNSYDVKAYKSPNLGMIWQGWHVEFQGQRYYTKFKDYNDWLSYQSSFEK